MYSSRVEFPLEFPELDEDLKVTTTTTTEPPGGKVKIFTNVGICSIWKGQVIVLFIEYTFIEFSFSVVYLHG